MLNLNTLFDNPRQWTKGPFAKDDTGKSCPPTSPQACQWCLMGRLTNLQVSPRGIACVEQAIAKLHNTGLFEGNIVRFNERPDTTYAHVKQVLAEAQYIYETQ